MKDVSHLVKNELSADVLANYVGDSVSVLSLMCNAIRITCHQCDPTMCDIQDGTTLSA